MTRLFRIHFVEHMKQLKVLDLRKVTDDERRQVERVELPAAPRHVLMC